MNRSCFGFILASFLALPTYAEYALEACPSTDLGEKVKCLEQHLKELDEHINTERERSQRIIKELLTQIENLKGPKKIVELIPEKISAVTIGYWAKGHEHQVFDCVPPIENKAGYTLYGAELSEEMDGSKLNKLSEEERIRYHSSLKLCHAHGWCDSAGEFCHWKDRTKGCYVNTEWYNWYLKMNGLQSSIYQINYDTICSQ